MPAFLISWGLKALPFIIGLAVVVGVLFAADQYGYHAGSAAVQSQWDADKAARAAIDAKAMADAQAQTDANAHAAMAASAQSDADQEQVRVVYQTLTNTVTKYVQAHPAAADCRVDDDGLRLWNAANAGSGDGGTAGDGVAGTAAAVPVAPAGR